MKLTETQKNRLRRLYVDNPQSVASLAGEFGISRSLVYKLCGSSTKARKETPIVPDVPHDVIMSIKENRLAGCTLQSLAKEHKIPVAMVKAFCAIDNPDETIRAMHKRGVRMEQIALETGAPLSRVRKVCITTRTEFAQRTVITEAKARKIRTLRAKGLYLDLIATRCGIGVDKVKEVLAKPHPDGIKRVSVADLEREGLWALVNRFGFRVYGLVLTKELEILDFRNDPVGLTKYE